MNRVAKDARAGLRELAQTVAASLDAKPHVFLVLLRDCEMTEIKSVHSTYKGALNAWDELRKETIADYRRRAGSSLWRKVSRGHEQDMYRKIIRRLQCRDPKKINNFPHSTPQIEQMEVKP